MRQKIIAANWKMNLSCHEAAALFSQVLEFAGEIPKNTAVIIFPPYLYIKEFAKKVASSKNISVGAQNCHAENEGAYTGEISAEMLKSVGAKYCIIGHSERRQYSGETDETVNKKIKTALAVSLNTILCVGETIGTREKNEHFQKIKSQLETGLSGVDIALLSKIIIAYEPVWAIGTGITASPGQAQEIHAYIRKTLAEMYSPATAEKIPVIYGGSCNAENAAGLFACPDIDGGLIGGASLKAQSFISIIKSS